MLLDTGSVITLVSENIWNSLPAKGRLRPTPEKQFRVANGGTLSTRGTAEVYIEVAGVAVHHPVHVVPQIPHSLCIGVDFLSIHKMDVLISQGLLTGGGLNARLNFIPAEADIHTVWSQKISKFRLCTKKVA